MSVLRSALFNIAFFGSTALLALACLVVGGSERASLAFARIWADVSAWLLKRIIGLRLAVRGRENIPDGPYVVASKHQSTWDTIMYFRLLPHPAYVVKREVRRIPVFGLIGEATGWIEVDRTGGARALSGLVRDVRAALAAGRQPVIFSEGTRTAPGERRSYQRGIAAVYLFLKVPIVPVALNSGLYWGRRSFIKRPGCVTVEFLPPILPGLDAEQFMAELEDRIETATAKLVASRIVDKSVDKSSTQRGQSL
jgi:1-acyl-sn-glycerol-3-phosphate acyltransferase